jgi:hypothetical protein
MIVHIHDWGRGYHDDYKYDSNLGLRYIINLGYEVIDKQVFMLAIIKHGIQFKEIKCSM